MQEPSSKLPLSDTPSWSVTRWALGHPIGTVMMMLALVVLGIAALDRLNIDLLPKLIYPEVRVRILDPGVPAEVMEDRVTRQLEEQLAITEDAIGVQSTSGEGRSEVNLSFEYGTDIDRALRDASTRLDRAKRFLPDSIDPPVIYKRDPSQIPVLEFVVGSALRGPVELRTWVDDVFAKWFLNVPGVAAAEVGGGLIREILVLPDQRRMAALGLSIADLKEALRAGNVETPAGRLYSARQQLSGRTAGRFQSLDELSGMPIRVADGSTVRLDELAEVVDGAEDEKLRVRNNGIPGVKLSIQKQPTANTVSVVDEVRARMAWLKDQGLIPDDIHIDDVSDQAVFVRRALDNATLAAGSGALLAMFIVWLFLGNLRRTLIVSSAIPIAIMVTFALMAWGGLTLNIMTLGGLALGVGMLVDNTIVMLENIQRHQKAADANGDSLAAADHAAGEVQGAIIASTSTNLAAVLPFLFISGLVGLLFRELIFTISAAIAASLLVALTLVPTLAARVAYKQPNWFRRGFDRGMEGLQNGYGWLLGGVIRVPWLPLILFVAGLFVFGPRLIADKQEFLPPMDEGSISINVSADTGITLDEMDAAVARIEKILHAQPETVSVFTIVGGRIFGRSEYESPNASSIQVQLIPASQRTVSDREWIKRIKKEFDKARMAGITVRARARGIRGVRLSSGDDDLSIRITGPDLETLRRIGDQAVTLLKKIDGLSNVQHSSEEVQQELSIQIDRNRAADLGLSVEGVGRALREALEGAVVSDYLDGDRSYDIRLRMPTMDIGDPQAVQELILFGADGKPLRLTDIANIELVEAPSSIMRDRQTRIVEISATLAEGVTLTEGSALAYDALKVLKLPTGYLLYDGGANEQLAKSNRLARTLLGLALFLVFVVMAVQYESIRNPLVIMTSVPFCTIGVALGLEAYTMPISMPVWLGLILLAGIVVNNAIIVVEFIELYRSRGMALRDAIVTGARLRLRPVLMTTLTTVVGMLPLALAIGDGTEMLQPLAVTIVFGLSFSVLVSLFLVPAVYRMVNFRSA